MIGLEDILRIWEMQHQELATKLGIKKQNINLWISGKQAISKKYLPILSEMFGVSEEMFQRELTDLEKLYIQKAKIEKEAEDIEYEYTDPYSGVTYMRHESTLDVTNYIYIEYEIKRKELLKKIDNRLGSIIDISMEEQEKNSEFASFEQAISEASDKVSFYEKLINLDAIVDPYIYQRIVRALTVVTGKGIDSDSFTRKLVKLISTEIEKKEKERQKNYNMYKEIFGEFKDKTKDIDTDAE
jgi:plasmid maintenance system antidote protein VapI